MLKFLIVTVLFLGLLSQAELNQETEVAKDAEVFNEKVSSEEASQESEESFESEESAESEEESEEDDESDYAGAVDKVVSEDNYEEFDQNDDYGSKVLEDKQEEEDQEDDSGACGQPRCRYFLAARRGFYIWRNRCIGCLRSRHGYCHRMCRVYHHHRRHLGARCRKWTIHHLRGWHRALRVNWARIAQANKMMYRYLYYIRLYRRRCRNMSYRTIYHRRIHYYRKYHWALKYYRHFLRLRNHNYRYFRHYLYHRNRNRHRRRYWVIYNRKMHHFLRLYNHYNRLVHRFAHLMRVYLHHFRLYHKYFLFYRNIHAWVRAYHAWRRRKIQLLKRRRWLWARRNYYYRVLIKRCYRTVRGYYWRCVLCKGVCGVRCWHMHHHYALMIFRAHQCRLQTWLCKRKSKYLRYYHAYNRSCHYCWRKTHPRLRHLVCGSRCGARYKFLLLFRYYHHKCHR